MNAEVKFRHGAGRPGGARIIKSRTTASRIGRATLLVIALAAGIAVTAPAVAHAAQNDLAFRGCDTGDTDIEACVATSDATAGANSGMAAALDIAVSPDGEHVYVDSQSDTSIAWFTRNQTTGELTYTDGDCVSGETTLGGVCEIISTASGGGDDSGLHLPSDLALSPNGEFLYATSQGDAAIAVFDRDPTTGDLDFLDCVTGDDDAGSGGSSACTDSSAPQASGGPNSGLHLVSGLAVTGNSVYAVSSQDDSIVRVARNQMTGLLSSFSCHSTEIESGPALGGGTGACAEVGTPTAGGASTGLNTPTAVEVSAGSVYVASSQDAAITRFSRDGTGALTYQDCITGEQETNVCVDSDTVTPAGAESGLHALVDLVASPDGEALYAVSGGDAAISHFDRDSSTGAIDFQECLTAETESGPTGSDACAEIAGAASTGANSGLDALSAASMTDDGESLYTTGPDDDAIGHFERDPTSGALSYVGCLTGEDGSAPPCAEITDVSATGSNTGLDNARELVATGDGESVYAVASSDSAVAHFNREDPPETTIDDGPPAVTADNSPTFMFSSPEPLTTFDAFECSLDGSAFGSCSGPGDSHTPASPLSEGDHAFSVRARDTWGFADATPATSNFTVDAVPDPPPQNPPQNPSAGDTDPPETMITKQPKKKVKTSKPKKKAKFEFGADEAGSSFECQVDGKGFAPCSSPFSKKVKSDKKHAFEVRATDAAGNVDPTPSLVKWKVKRT